MSTDAGTVEHGTGLGVGSSPTSATPISVSPDVGDFANRRSPTATVLRELLRLSDCVSQTDHGEDASAEVSSDDPGAVYAQADEASASSPRPSIAVSLSPETSSPAVSVLVSSHFR